MGIKKPDDLTLVTTDGISCDVVRHVPTKLNNPLKIRYIADITLWGDDDFDIDFTLQSNGQFKIDDEIKDSVHLMDAKALLKYSLKESQLQSDSFFKHLFRDFLSKHFEIHALDLLIRVVYDEENYPESIFITFDVEKSILHHKLKYIDGEFCAYLYELCLVNPQMWAK